MIAMLAMAGVLLTGIAGHLRGGEFNVIKKLMQARVGLHSRGRAAPACCLTQS